MPVPDRPADVRGVHVRSGPGAPDGLVIPEAELTERFSRSPGPGGQSVNTTDTRVELAWDPAASAALTERQRERVTRPTGPIVVVAHEHRSQHRNRITVRERLAERVRDLVAPPPPPRRPTKPSRASRERRLAAKKRRGRTKALRGRVRDRGDD